MLSRLSTHFKLTLLALALVIIPGALVIVGQSGWGTQRVHEFLTRGITEATGREVMVGPISGNLLKGITIDGLAIAKGKRLREGAMVATGRVKVDYDLMSVLRGRLAPLASVRRITVWNPHLYLVRDPRGRLNLQDLMPPPTTLPPAKRFRGTLVVHNADVVYTDQSWYVATGQETIHLVEGELEADVTRITRVVSRSRARFADGRATMMAGEVIFDYNSPFVDVSGHIDGVDTAWGMRAFGLQKGFTVTGGRIDLRGSAYRVAARRGSIVDFAGTGHLHGVTVRAPGVPGTLQLDGEAFGNRAGFAMRNLTSTFGGSRYAVTGSLGPLSKPSVDMFIASDHVRLGPLAKIAPMPGGKLQAGGNASVRLSVIGPPSSPDVRLQATMEEPLSVQAGDLGTVRGEGLKLTAEVVGLKRPVVSAKLTGRSLGIPKLKLAATGSSSWPKRLSVAPVTPVAVEARWCDGMAAVQAEVRVPQVRADNFTASNLRTKATLVGDLLRLQGLRAEMLGGKLAAEAAVSMAGGELGVRARGSLKGVDLARLKELPLKDPREFTGSANVTFQAKVSGKKTTGMVDVAAADVITKGLAVKALVGTFGVQHEQVWRGAGRVKATGVVGDEFSADRAEALFDLNDKLATIHGGYFQGPDGVGLVRGEVDLEGKTMDLRVAGAELPVAKAEPYLGVKGLSGIAYASGTVGGSFQRPSFSGRVTVFDPAFKEHELDALTATVRVQGDTLVADDLYASLGNAILSGQGTVHPLGAPPEQMAVQAEVQGQGLRLGELARLAGKDWKVDGLAELTAQVSGSVARPQARGTLRVFNARYDNVPVARVRLSFALDQNRLTVTEAQGRVLDSPFTAQFTMQLGETPELDGFLTAEGLKLEGLAPFWESQLPLGGTVRVPRIWVKGPTDNLQGGAHIIAPEINLGGEMIRDLDANVTLSKGRVQLQETAFEAAGGRVVVKAGVDYGSDPKTIAAEIDLMQTNVADMLYLAVPIAQAAEGDDEAKAAKTRQRLRSYALRLKGVLDGTVNLAGPLKSPQAVFDLKGTKLVADGREVPDFEGRGTASSTGLQEVSASFRQGEAMITVDGDMQFDGPLNASIEGSGIELASMRPWVDRLLPQLPQDLPLSGRLGFTVVASGQSSAPELMASVDVMNPSFAGVAFDVLSVPVATVNEGEITVDTLVIKRGEQEIVVDGKLPFSWNLPVGKEGSGETQPGLIPNGQVLLGARIEKTPLAFFLPLADEHARARRKSQTTGGAAPFRWATMQAQGVVDSSVKITGTVADPTLRGYLRLENGSLQPAQWKNAFKGLQADLALTGTGRDNLLEIKELTGTYDQVKVDVEGHAYLDHVGVTDFWRNRFEVRTKVAASEQTVAPGVKITDVAGALLLKTEAGKQIVTAEDLGFSLGGGRATLSGKGTITSFDLAQLANNQLDYSFKMTPGRVTYSSLLNAMVGGDLRIVTPPGRTRALVKGSWTISDGVLGLASAGLAAGASHALSSRLPSPDLEIQGSIGKGMSFRGAGVKAPLDPMPAALRIVGTPQHPVATGSVISRGGSTVLPTATMRITYFGVNYSVDPVPADRSDPVELRIRGTLQGLAETSINRPGDSPIRVAVELTGQLPDQVTVRATSNPPLSQTQIYALLGGVPFSHLPGLQGRDPNLREIVSEQFLATLANAFRLTVFTPIEEQIKKLLGLDELAINFAFEQAVSVRIGKYVIRNMLVSYERPLSEGAERFDLRVSYELPGGMRISYHNDERSDQTLEVSYNTTF